MKISELDSSRLDFWVARAEGWTRFQLDHGEWQWRSPPKAAGEEWEIEASEHFSPTSDWGDAGPTIENEGICIVKLGAKRWAAYLRGRNGYSGSGYIDTRTRQPDGIGHSAMVAAMRAFVFSKFGPEVPG